MALVSYGYDSDEASEQEEEENTQSAIIIPQPTNNKELEAKTRVEDVRLSVNSEVHNSIVDIEDRTDSGVSTSSLLSQLPKSKTIKTVQNKIEDEIEDFIPKAPKVSKPEKKKEKVKITIPLLTEFNLDDSDDDEPVEKKFKPSSKASGLLSLLPPVKGEPLSNKSFVPQSVTKKNKQNSQKPEGNNSLIPNAVRRKQQKAVTVAAEEKKAAISKKSLESDDEDDIEIPETFDDEMWQKVCGRPKPKPIHREEIIEESYIQQEVNIAPEPEKPYTGLDNTAFKELVGKNRKRENITIKDIHEDDIMPDKDLWMTKALTDPECAPKHVEEDDEVDPTKRRKHHITYLAQQAKANEQELQSQWASNKFSRSQTRAKYGF